MRALSVRQPWAELIVRGSKTIECRSRPTYVRERIWIYAAEGRSLFSPVSAITVADSAALPRGVLVGSVELVACRALRPDDASAACCEVDFEGYAWLMLHAERLVTPLRPTSRPQPAFFHPFAALDDASPVRPVLLASHRRTTGAVERVSQDVLDLRVEAAQIVGGPLLHGFEHSGVDAKQERLALGHETVRLPDR